MKRTRTLLTALLLGPLAALHAAEAPLRVPQSPTQLWADYDPNKGDFKEEIISEETKDGIANREFYIGAYVLGEDVRVYCKYSAKAGITNAPGLLIDSCTIPDGRIDLINRQSSGSGHGWAIGWGIVWNGTVKHLQIQMPPGALNLAIGCKGEPHKTYSKEAFFSANEPLTPASLYLAQLRERLGEAAVKNIGY